MIICRPIEVTCGMAVPSAFGQDFFAEQFKRSSPRPAKSPKPAAAGQIPLGRERLLFRHNPVNGRPERIGFHHLDDEARKQSNDLPLPRARLRMKRIAIVSCSHLKLKQPIPILDARTPQSR